MPENKKRRGPKKEARENRPGHDGSGMNDADRAFRPIPKPNLP